MAFADSAYSATMLKWQDIFLEAAVFGQIFLVIFIQNMMCSTVCIDGPLDVNMEEFYLPREFILLLKASPLVLNM
jgi:hypothetical protein